MHYEGSGPPKIMLISNCTWNVHNFWMELIEQLQGAGCEVLVVAGPDAFASFVTQNPLLRFVPLRHLHPTSMNPWHDVLLMRELYRIIKQETPSAILTFTIKPNLYGGILAKRFSIQVIPTVTGLGYTFINRSWMNGIVRSLYRLAFKGLSKVIVQNPSDLALLKKHRILQGRQGMILAGAGVDTLYYSATPMPSPERFVFLYLGRILVDKGIRELAEAAQRIRKDNPHAEFWIAGMCPENHPSEIDKYEFQHWVGQGVFKFWGWQNDVRFLIEQSQVIVLPSYREGLSSTLLEAMAMARPLVVTDVPGCRETVKMGHNGWLAKARDATDLERCLRDAIHTSPEKLQQMGHNSRERVVEEFSIDRVNKAYLALLTKAVLAKELSLIEP